MSDQPKTLPPLIQQMLVSEFYPHPTASPIRLIQTHISFLLLTGPYAYKIKKPVKLAFVDFSTLQRRHHFCLEELRLNWHGAPNLYIEVVPIAKAANAFQLGGVGEAVEYAVKMREFPQESLFFEMLRHSRLGATEIEALAKVIARYHARALASPAISQFGEPRRIRDAMENNYRETERFIGTLQTREHFEQTKAFTDRFLDDHDDALRQRVSSGRIRECHGDLHLNNICLWEGKVQLFDCIEFNDAFRNVDVMYDIAFAAMDLEAAGRLDLATLLINTYAELSGDWEGMGILWLYLCRQAYVRAKVNSLMVEETEVSEPERQSARQRATQYYDLAWRYAQARKGKLTIVCGLSGSGKSTVARKLALQDGAVHIRSDALRKHLAHVPLDQRGGAEIYTPEMSARTYARLADVGIRLAVEGFGVILDAKYDRRAVRESLLHLANKNGLPVEIVYCDAPIDVRRQRVKDRQNDVSDATAAIVDQQSEFEPFGDAERGLLRVINTERDGAME